MKETSHTDTLNTHHSVITNAVHHNKTKLNTDLQQTGNTLAHFQDKVCVEKSEIGTHPAQPDNSPLT